MTVRAPVGSVGYVSEYSCIGKGVCSMKTKIADKHFLYHILIFREPDWKIIEQGSTFTSANSNQIFDFPIYIPKSKDEPISIGKILNNIDAEIEQLQNQLSKYKLVKQGMMQNLLTDKVRLTETR